MGPVAGMISGLVFQFDRKAPAKGVGEDRVVVSDSRGLARRPAYGGRYGLKAPANHGEPNKFRHVRQFHGLKAEDSLADRPVFDLLIYARSDIGVVR